RGTTVPDNQASGLRASVEAVVDPLLGRRLGDLGMVADVSEKRFGSDTVKIRVPVPNHPALRDLDAAVRDAVDGRMTVELETMDADQRHEMMERLRAAVSPGLGQPGNRTRVIAISSGKGGVGKSSVSTNLAVTLAAAGRRVGIIDGDI